MRDKVKAVLDEIRPMLQADGGDIELVNITDKGVVEVRLQGICPDCLGSMMTLKQGVERMLKEQVPEVEEVVTL